MIVKNHFRRRRESPESKIENYGSVLQLLLFPNFINDDLFVLKGIDTLTSDVWTDLH